MRVRPYPTNVAARQMSDLSAQLNALVNQLSQPSYTLDDRKKKFRAVAYYLPLIKNPQNLWMVLQTLSLSPNLLFGNAEDVPIILYAVDSISYACDRKRQITTPTLTPQRWESELTKIIYHLPPVFGLIITSGLVNANVAAELHLPVLVKAVGMSPKLIPVASACLMRAQWSRRISNSHLREMPFAFEMVDFITSQLLYTQQNLSLQPSAISADLGGWSRLISGLLLSQPSHVLLRFLKNVQLFLRTVSALQESPEKLKLLFFGILIQLEGVCEQILTTPSLQYFERVSLATEVLQVLQSFHFVTEHLGTQFDSYQFVLNTCLDTLGKRDAVKKAVPMLGERWVFGQNVSSPILAGELIFFFEISEQLMPVISNLDAERLILPIVERFIGNCDIVSVFEAAHSCMLAYLATHSNFNYPTSETALQYFNQIMQLFPHRLGASQFRTAVMAVIRAVDKSDANHILERLFSAAKSSIPGFMLPYKLSNAMHSAATSAPTIRAALISSIFHAAASSCDAPGLDHWLSRITTMVPEPFSATVLQEREFLLKDFSDIVTSLGNETSDVGIRWYFKNGWNSSNARL